MLNGISVPAFVMGSRTDFLLWNRPFTGKFLDLNSIPKERRTWLDMTFIENKYRSLPEWKENARRVVAEFRWSVGKQIGSPWVKELVARMCKESPEFAQLWRLHDIQERNRSRIIEKLKDGPGKDSYVRSIYIPAEAEDLRLVILAPLKRGVRDRSRRANGR